MSVYSGNVTQSGGSGKFFTKKRQVSGGLKAAWALTSRGGEGAGRAKALRQRGPGTSTTNPSGSVAEE